MKGDNFAPPPVVVGRDVPSKRNRLKQLRLFCYTALTGSITRAAERASVTQPSVSQQVRALEEELQLQLFERQGPRIALTTAGRHLYELSMPLVEGMDNLYTTFHERFSRSISGRVRIVTEPSAGGFLLPPYLKQFRAQYPHVGLNVQTLPGQSALKLLRAHEVDFVVGTRDLLPDDFQYHQIRAVEIMLATHEDHPLARHELVSARAVEKHPMILPNAGTHTRYLWNLYARRHNVKLDAPMEVSAAWIAMKLVQNGLGISILPSLCVEEGAPISLIPFAQPFPRLFYDLVTHRDMLLSAAARQFIQMMVPDHPAAA
ncbi:MAG: LysR family transcriptional regulator [Gammaproteobacteria bacterium]|nr:LysR family transcriptional regulator [Gammaproteobacteria bacterium]